MHRQQRRTQRRMFPLLPFRWRKNSGRMNGFGNALRYDRRAFCFSSAILLLLFVIGCSRYDRADLVIVNGPEPESLDPAIITGQADGRIALTIFEGLTRYNETN